MSTAIRRILTAKVIALVVLALAGVVAGSRCVARRRRNLRRRSAAAGGPGGVTDEVRVVGALDLRERAARPAQLARSSPSPDHRASHVPRSRAGAARRERHRCQGRILAPGLVNAHTHAAMSLLRGHSNDAPLAEWLEDIRAFELRMTYDDVRAGLALALVEMLRCRHRRLHRHAHVGRLNCWASSSKSGMRVRAAPAIFGYDAVGYPLASADTGARLCSPFDARTRRPSSRGNLGVRVSYGPHAFYSAGVDLMREVVERSRGRWPGHPHPSLGDRRSRSTTPIGPSMGDRRSGSPPTPACSLRDNAYRTRRASARRRRRASWAAAGRRCRTTRSAT